MRIAVMSDIHGFSLALERVLADIDATGPHDAIVVAGDLCEVGPDPAGVVRIIRARGLPTVIGNTDWDLAEAARFGDRGGAVGFALRELGDEGVEWLAQLPFDRRITPAGGTSPDDDLLVCHANPNDLRQRLDPSMTDRELREVIGQETRAGAIAFGHIHLCYTRQLDDTLLVDVSAVGNPKDGDLSCKYGVVTWDMDSRKWTAEIRRVPYPVEETRAQMASSGLPGWERAFEKLLRASYGSRD